MRALLCVEPGRTCGRRTAATVAGAGRSSGAHPPRRGLRHRFPHLRGLPPLPRISARHRPRTVGRGRGDRAGLRYRGRPAGLSSSPISPAAPASPAGAARPTAVSASACSASTSTAAWRITSACRRPMSRRPTGLPWIRRRWSSSSPSAPTRSAAPIRGGRPHSRRRRRTDRPRLHAVRQAARRLGHRARPPPRPAGVLPQRAWRRSRGRRGAGRARRAVGADRRRPVRRRHRRHRQRQSR